MTLFSRKIFEHYSYEISWKTVRWHPRYSLRTDGHIDMTKLMIAFRNFATALKNLLLLKCFTVMLEFLI